MLLLLQPCPYPGASPPHRLPPWGTAPAGCSLASPTIHAASRQSAGRRQRQQPCEMSVPHKHKAQPTTHCQAAVLAACNPTQLAGSQLLLGLDMHGNTGPDSPAVSSHPRRTLAARCAPSRPRERHRDLMAGRQQGRHSGSSRAAHRHLNGSGRRSALTQQVLHQLAGAIEAQGKLLVGAAVPAAAGGRQRQPRARVGCGRGILAPQLPSCRRRGPSYLCPAQPCPTPPACL